VASWWVFRENRDKASGSSRKFATEPENLRTSEPDAVDAHHTHRTEETPHSTQFFTILLEN